MIIDVSVNRLTRLEVVISICVKALLTLERRSNSTKLCCPYYIKWQVYVLKLYQKFLRALTAV